jgi:hypothetical protein
MGGPTWAGGFWTQKPDPARPSPWAGRNPNYPAHGPGCCGLPGRMHRPARAASYAPEPYSSSPYRNPNSLGPWSTASPSPSCPSILSKSRACYLAFMGLTHPPALLYNHSNTCTSLKVLVQRCDRRNLVSMHHTEGSESSTIYLSIKS